MTTPRKVRYIDVRLTAQECNALCELLAFAETELENQLRDADGEDDELLGLKGPLEEHAKTLAMFYKKLDQAETDSHGQ